MLRNIFLLLIFAFSSANAKAEDPLSFDRFECTAVNAHQARCQIFLKGTVKADDMLFISQVYDMDRVEFGSSRLGQTGFRLQSSFYARFLPRTYALQNIAGEKNPVLTLIAESFLGTGAGLFDDSVVKIVSAQKEWPLQAKALWFPAFLALFCFGALIYGLWFSTNSAPADGWLWGVTELRVFYFSTVVAVLFTSEWPKLLVPNLLNAGQYFYVQRLIWTLVLWSLSQLLCESVFSDPSALERIRSRTTWLDKALTYAAGFFLLTSIMLSPFERSYGLIVQLFGLGLIASARVWQTRFSRVLRRSHLPGIYLYTSLLGFAGSLIISQLIKPERPTSIAPLPLTFALFGLFSVLNRHRSLRTLRDECRFFVDDCRQLLMTNPSGKERVEIITSAVQEYWDGARVSLVSLRNEHGLLLSSNGPLALSVHAGLEARRVGPLVRRVCREKHILYAPVSEELGRDLADQGLRYSTVAIPVCEKDEVRSVLLFMAHEGDRIAPRDAMGIQWVGEAMRLEISAATQQMLAEENLASLQSHIRSRDGLLLEEIDAWGRISLQSTQAEARLAVICKSPTSSSALARAIAHSSALAYCHQVFSQELLNQWQQIRQQYEFLSHEEAGHLLFVAPRTFQKEALKELGAQKVSVILGEQLIKQAQHLLQEDRFRLLHLETARIGIWHEVLEPLAISEFCRRMSSQNRSPLYTESAELRFMLEESHKIQLKIKRAA